MSVTVDEVLHSLDNPSHTIRSDSSSQVDKVEGKSNLTRAIEALTAEIHSTYLVEQESRISLVRAIETLSGQISQCLPRLAWENTVGCCPKEKRLDTSSTPEKDFRVCNEGNCDGLGAQAICKATPMPLALERDPSNGATSFNPAVSSGHLDSSANDPRKFLAPLELIQEAANTSALTGSQPTKNPLIPAMEARYEPYELTTARNETLTQWLPKVDVSIKIYHVTQVDTASMTFQADFVICLDWFDHNLKDFEGELHLLDRDKKFFNPKVSIDNATGSKGWLEGADTIPRWYPSSKPPSGTERHLRKSMRFRGFLYMSRADMRCFPLDMHLLPIHLKGVPCRKLERVIMNGEGSKLPKEAFRFYVDDSTVMFAEHDYLKAQHKMWGIFLKKDAGDLLVDFGFAGIHGQPGTEEYRVNIVVERPWFSSHSWNLIIMNVLAMLAIASFWDGASPDVSSRMSITLTVILTIAVSTRPLAIEKTTYETLSDRCQQTCLAIVTIISILNVITVQICGGHHPESPMYMQEFYAKSKYVCEISWCGSTWIDCHSLLSSIVLWVLCVVGISFWTWKIRQQVMSGVLPAADPTREPSSTVKLDNFPSRSVAWTEPSQSAVQQPGSQPNSLQIVPSGNLHQ